MCALNVIITIIIQLYLPIEPLDYNLIINETSIYLSSRYTTDFRNIMDLEEFKNEIEIKADFKTKLLDNDTLSLFDKSSVGGTHNNQLN